MHCVDCQGCAAFVFGGVLVHLLGDARLGGSRQERLDRISGERVEFYRALPGSNRLTKILKSSVQNNDGWGCLSGPAFKAAITRGLRPFSVRSYGHTAKPIQLWIQISVG